MRAVGPEVLCETVCNLLSCSKGFSRYVGDESDVRSRVVIAVGDGKRASSDDVFGFQSELGPADDASSRVASGHPTFTAQLTTLYYTFSMNCDLRSS